MEAEWRKEWEGGNDRSWNKESLSLQNPPQAQLRGGVACGRYGEGGGIDAFSRKIVKSFLTLANSKNIDE